MAESVTYTNQGKVINFLYPTITVSVTPQQSGTQTIVASIVKVFTIRSLVIASTNELLDHQLEDMREILSVGGGIVSIAYSSFQAPLVLSPERDIKYGPTPTGFAIEKFHGGKCALVTWQVQSEQFATDTDYLGETGRWVDMVYSLSTSIDANLFATRIISGVLRVNPNAPANVNFTSDSFRQTVADYFKLPGERNGQWQRLSQDYTQSEDFTGLMFRIVDRQTYAWLPENMTGGNLEVSTYVAKNGAGSISLRGFFEATNRDSRATVLDLVLNLLTGFNTHCIKNIYVESGAQDGYLLTEESCQITYQWRANRIDFANEWNFYGLLKGTEKFEVQYNTTFAAKRVLAWLSKMSRGHLPYGSHKPTDEMLDPYGTSGVCGRTGSEGFAPIIDIRFEDKNRITRGNGADNDHQSNTSDYNADGNKDTNKYKSFKQEFHYKIKSHIQIIPTLSDEYRDIIQRTQKPEVYLMINGSAETIGSPPETPLAPYPIFDPDNDGIENGLTIDTTAPFATMIQCDIRPEEPSPDGEYKMSWSYLLRLHNIKSSFLESIKIRSPYTPLWQNKTWTEEMGRKYEIIPFPAKTGTI
jgi:hypothetical protein